MRKYNKLVKNLETGIKSFELDVPSYYKTALSYVKTVKPFSAPILINALQPVLSDRYKQFSREFSVTQEDFRYHYLSTPKGDQLLKDLLDAMFEYKLLNDKTFRRRYGELLLVTEQFVELIPNIHFYEMPRHVVVVFALFGQVVKYSKPKGFTGLVVDEEQENVYMFTEDGEYTTICDNRVFSENCVTGLVDLQKGYKRVDFIDKVYVRAHLLVMALTFGVELVKHCLGNDSYLTIDHIDGVEDNNDLRNLRIVTRSDNGKLKADPSLPVFDFIMLDTIPKKLIKSEFGFSTTAGQLFLQYL